MFKPVSPKPNFVKIEHRILGFWRKNDILEKYLQRNDSADKKFSFLDGPITANNPMGVHHAWGRTLKDLYQRYKNMRGLRQRFQNGFDNQGLWVEVEVERELGFKSKKDIEKFGVSEFVEKCKEHTLKFAGVQTEQSKRLGYFMDWGNDYFTMSDENNYAIWHFLKKVWQDGNLYQGRDSVPWCPRCGTAISQHEILTEEYKELTHYAVYLRYPLANFRSRSGTLTAPGASEDREEAVSLLVWTTTPWTIPGNVALAVNPEITYVEIDRNPQSVSQPRRLTGRKSEHLILAKSRLSVISEPYKIIREFKGLELEGIRYEGPFDDLEQVKEAREENPETFHTVVLSKDLVSEEEGTGIVHIAPGAGTEDFRLGREKNLPVIAVIDEAANYLEGFGDLSGKNAKDNPRLVLDHPLLQDFVFRIEPYTHRYPVCWRCQTELVWRVVSEWYIAMDDERCPEAKNYRQRLQKVIRDVRWIPEFGYERELDWLRNMEDWLISKKRYWGLALPIWECSCGHFEVIGSKEELKERAVEGWEKFSGRTPHRPWVDRIKIECTKCGKPIKRIPDVGNPWLDAGIVPFSTLKYFEDRDYWKEWFPADLVLEALPGQFKNWFYSLLAMSTVLENRAPFRTLFGHALVKDEHGEEMHKSKGNAIWFDDAAEKMGVDVMRWLYVVQDPTRDLWFGYSPADEVRRRFFLILWNCYKFFVTYAALDKPFLCHSEFISESDTIPETSSGQALNQVQDDERNKSTILDRWILSRLSRLIREVTSDLDVYQNPQAARAIENFVVNDLSTWYIRRSRGRVGPTASDRSDKQTAHQTLYSVLLTLAKLISPFIPFLAEEMYQNLAAGQRTNNLGSRHSEFISESDGTSEKMLKQVQHDANGKLSVHLCGWPEFDKSLIDDELEEKMELVREICEKGHAARREKGIKVRQPLKKLKIKDQKSKTQIKNQKRGAAFTDLIKDELNVKKVVFEEGGKLEVELDFEITPELRVEGAAREMVRQIQDARKEAGCNLDDRIVATYPDTKENREVVEEHGDYIKKETLSDRLEPGGDFTVQVVGT